MNAKPNATENAHWSTAPTESTATGRLIMVTGRTDVSRFRSNPRFIYRVDISLPYEADSSGMPRPEMAEILGDVTDALESAFGKDPVAVLTGIYTGDGSRDWVCYTLSLHIFQKKLNEALASLPLLPLQFHAEEDPGWTEYDNMRATAQLTDDTDEDDAEDSECDEE